MNIAKWVLSIIAVAALIFGAIQASFLRQEMTEQKNLLTAVQNSQSEKLAELEQGHNKLIEESKAFEDKLLSATMDAREHQPFGVVWSYGTGLPGSADGQLFYPTTAEEMGKNTILIADKRNNRVLLLDKTSGEVNWEYREDTDKLQPSSAHLLSSGIYKDCILIAGRYYDGTKYIGKIRIIDMSKTLKWSLDMDNEDLGDAILWDESNLMVSSRMTGKITKIDLSCFRLK